MGMSMRIVQGKYCREYDIPTEISEVLLKYGHIFDPQGTDKPYERPFMDMGIEVGKDELCNRLLSIDNMASLDSNSVYTYTFEFNINNDPNLHIKSSTVYQFNRNGRIYEIECGYNACKIRLLHWDSQGRVTVEEESDGRHLQQIETDDWGPIIIKKRRVRNQFSKWASKVIKSLNGVEGSVRVEIV